MGQPAGNKKSVILLATLPILEKRALTGNQKEMYCFQHISFIKIDYGIVRLFARTIM